MHRPLHTQNVYEYEGLYLLFGNVDGNRRKMHEARLFDEIIKFVPDGLVLGMREEKIYDITCIRSCF